MGYYTRFEGELEVDPPFTWAELRDSPFTEEGNSGRSSEFFTILVTESVEETEDGHTVTKRGLGVRVTYSDDCKAYDFENHFARFWNMHGEGHIFHGEFKAWGEDNEDVWKARIGPDGPERVEAELTFPAWPSAS